jgi:hypothetical protein
VFKPLLIIIQLPASLMCVQCFLQPLVLTGNYLNLAAVRKGVEWIVGGYVMSVKKGCKGRIRDEIIMIKMIMLMMMLIMVSVRIVQAI